MNEKEQEQEKEQGKIVPEATVPSQNIMKGKKEIWIEHDGQRYRLRITKRNKLILQK